ncbi:conserved hypothetical protein [Trichinella spiralis]|uniref:hypothetical protein n=1 Tax=Trichinella spiralis TaxID=6334 RepID=UPI0001EFE7CA|nr:conserved hypothetical protein [Trichinella spiralis]
MDNFSSLERANRHEDTCDLFSGARNPQRSTISTYTRHRVRGDFQIYDNFRSLPWPNRNFVRYRLFSTLAIESLSSQEIPIRADNCQKSTILPKSTISFQQSLPTQNQ